MRYQRHGLSIGINRIDNEFVITMKAIGKLIQESEKDCTNEINDALIIEGEIEGLIEKLGVEK